MIGFRWDIGYTNNDSDLQHIGGKSMNTLNYHITELANGIRVITESISHVQSMSMGVWVGVGSRYEEAQENGITHFIEHMLFKGTERRSAQDIAEQIDAVGGQINAFTSKEYTCYYVKALSEDFDLAADILADMIFHSKFDENEVNKEREVIIEEIKMYEDTPDELVNDLFAQDIWGDQPLGRTILGTEEVLANLTGEKMHAYMKKHYTGINMVISVVGNIEHDKVVSVIQRLFSHVDKGQPNAYMPIAMGHSGVFCHYKDIGQAQICLGVPGVSNDSDLLYPIGLLNTYLGGGLSSRLVQRIREEMGLAYSVYSYHGAYSDTGRFVFSVGTRPENCQKVLDVIAEELRHVAEYGIDEKDLHRAFCQMKGSLFMGLESVNSRMNKLGRSLLVLDKVISPEETIQLLKQVTPADIQSIAKQLFLGKQYTVTVLGPVDQLEFSL